jgi:hypothetical protein
MTTKDKFIPLRRRLELIEELEQLEKENILLIQTYIDSQVRVQQIKKLLLTKQESNT